MFIDIDTALDRLQADFDRFLVERMPGDRSVAEQALRRLDLRPLRELPLVRNFSPIVVLYPTLIAEGIGEIEEEVVARATLAHLLFLIHAFLDDRYRDAELEPSPRELAFCHRLFSEGALQLVHALGETKLVRELTSARQAEYLVGQTARYHDSRGHLRSWREIRAIVIARAVLGSIAWEALAIHAAVPTARFQELVEGYRSLVVGMQWEDDLVDFRADRERRAENLLSALSQGLEVPAANPFGFAAPPSLEELLVTAFRALRSEWTSASRCLSRGVTLELQLALRTEAIERLEVGLGGQGGPSRSRASA
jgi:hypothetical protein